MTERVPLTVDTIRLLLNEITRAFEADPFGFLAIAQTAQEKLKDRHAESDNALVHIAEHLGSVMPSMADDPNVKRLLGRVTSPGNFVPDQPIPGTVIPVIGWAAGLGGAAAYGAIIAGMITYCMGTSGDAGPGESVDVHHIPLVC